MVISFGAPAKQLGLASIAAGAAVLVVGSIGALTAKPLAKVPEEWMKLGVGLLLSLFGTFWMGEGAGIKWPASDLFLLVILAVLLAVTAGLIAYYKKKRIVRAEVSA